MRLAHSEKWPRCGIVRSMSIVMIRCGLGAVGAAWLLYIGYLVVAAAGHRDLEPEPWRTVVVAVLVVATLGLLLERVLRRMETAISGGKETAVELGRQLERLRHDGEGNAEGVVLSLPRGGHAGVGR